MHNNNGTGGWVVAVEGGAVSVQPPWAKLANGSTRAPSNKELGRKFKHAATHAGNNLKRFDTTGAPEEAKQLHTTPELLLPLDYDHQREPHHGK